MSEHTLDRSLIHHDWDNSYEPVLAVARVTSSTSTC